MFAPERKCLDCGAVDDAYRRRVLVRSPIGNTALDLDLCPGCLAKRLAYGDTVHLCLACNFNLPDHGTHCPAGPDPGRLD